MNYKGVIIEESLKDQKILKSVTILETTIEKVTPEHKTPWLEKWTLHIVEVTEEKAAEFAEYLSAQILTEPISWYIDFKNKKWHYIIFPDKIFLVNRSDQKNYKEAFEYGVSLGIPEHQLVFSPEVDHLLD